MSKGALLFRGFPQNFKIVIMYNTVIRNIKWNQIKWNEMKSNEIKRNEMK